MARRDQGRKTCCKPWRGQARSPKRTPSSPATTARDHRRRHRRDADAQLRHRRLRHAGQPAPQRACAGSEIAGGKATVGAMTTLSELQAQRRARLPLGSARRDRLADGTQHGDGRRQSVRQAALWRPRRLPDRARRNRVDLRAVGRAQRARRKDRREPAWAAARSSPASRFALPAAGTFKFRKAARKAFNSAAIVTVAAVVSVSGGKIVECRIGLGGVAASAIRAPSVEKALIGKPLDRASVEAAAAEARHDISPSDDAYASAWYRARVDAGPHPPRTDRRIEPEARRPGRQP